MQTGQCYHHCKFCANENHHYQGFDDTLRFLQKRYMISCTRCLAVASTYEIEDEVDMEEWEVSNISINFMIMSTVKIMITINMSNTIMIPTTIFKAMVFQVQSGGCKEYDPNCLECKLQRHIASQSTVPENVWEVISMMRMMRGLLLLLMMITRTSNKLCT